MNCWVVQPKASFTTRLLEKYAVLPLYLRARVEGWNVTSADIKMGKRLDDEQVYKQIRSLSLVQLRIENDHADLRHPQRHLEGHRGRRQGNTRRRSIQW